MDTTTPDAGQQIPVTFDFSQERHQYDILIGQWRDEENKVKLRRDLRENKKNVEEERRKGVILEDETIIPDRTINLNIKRGRAPFISYITQSKRTLILVDLNNPANNMEPTEQWFTRGMRYPGWKYPWIKQIDCTHLHGGCAMEVMYDPTKPFNCTVEYIPRAELILPKKTKNIQAISRLLRVYEITVLQLSEFAALYGFDPDATKVVTDKYKDTSDLLKLYRVLYKKDGIVYNCWYTQDYNQTWLRDPQPHNIGLFQISDEDKPVIQMLMQTPIWDQLRESLAQPAQLQSYPIFWFPYDVTEDEEVLSIQGRAALDVQCQEAKTVLVTAAVNGCTRAAKFYPTAEGEPGNDAKLRELGPLKHGFVLQGKLNVFQAPWPNNVILAVTQVLDQQKSQETGDTDFASLARKDANKTATEMKLATGVSAKLTSVDVDIFTSPYLDTLALLFEITRHQAIFGLCQPPPDLAVLFTNLHMVPAGDVEVVQREEDRQNAKEFFDIVRGTPLAEKMFAFLLEHYFPDQARDWIAILNEPDKDQLIAQLVQMLQAVPTDELTPEQRTALQAIIISAQNVVAGSDHGAAPPRIGAPASAPAQASNESANAE